MSVASVSGRLRAQRASERAFRESLGKPLPVRPELSDDERRRHALISEAYSCGDARQKQALLKEAAALEAAKKEGK